MKRYREPGQCASTWLNGFSLVVVSDLLLCIQLFQMFDSQILPAPSLPQPNFHLDCSLTAKQIKNALESLYFSAYTVPGSMLRVGICPSSSHCSKSCWIGLRKYHLFHNRFTKWNAAGSTWPLSLLKLALFHWKMSLLVCGMRRPIHSRWSII